MLSGARFIKIAFSAGKKERKKEKIKEKETKKQNKIKLLNKKDKR